MSDIWTPGAQGATNSGRSGALSRRHLLRLTLLGGGALTLAPLLSACGGGAAPASAPAPAAAPGAPAAAPAAPAAAKPAQAGPGGFSGGGSLSLLLRAHFVPAFDKWFDEFAADWGKKNKVDVQVDHILSAELAAKIAAELAAGSGHDVIGLTRSGEANLYNKQLTDVTDVAKQVGEAGGGWQKPLAEDIAVVDGVWRGVPDYWIDFPVNYRKDIFDANNLKVPETWDDVLKVGTILKDKGNPIGIAINQKSNDANNSWTGLLWCYGASYVASDGKTPAIDSPATVEAVKMALELYNKTMTNEVLSWDDSGNNQMLAAGRASWIQNPISSLRTIEKQTPELAAKIYMALSPGGPKERVTPVSVNSFGLLNWSKNQAAAKQLFIDYFQAYGDAIKASEAYNQPILMKFRQKPMPGLGDNPKFEMLQDFDKMARVTGYPGKPTQAAGEVESNWIIPLMIGQAVQSGNAQEAVKWAAGKIDAIYAKYK
jgi:multiple sugar transport system substrate-binding protein